MVPKLLTEFERKMDEQSYKFSKDIENVSTRAVTELKETVTE